jgi:Papain family cysteine protease
MQMMALKGYLAGKTMPASLQMKLGAARPFADVHSKFVAKAADKAQDGGDYDIPNEPPAYDQGDIGSCVLNATCGALNTILGVEKQQQVMLSRLFLYWLCRYVMGTLDQDSGTYTHLAVDRVAKIGVPNESMWQYSDSNLYLPPPPECYPEASDNKATAWFQIQDPVDSSQPSRLDQLEAAIRSNHPATFGTPCDAAIMQYVLGQVLSIPSGAIIGGHSMMVSGVRYINGKRVWRIRNSWSPSYGDEGHLLIDDNWMSWPELDDIQVITRMDPLLF